MRFPTSATASALGLSVVTLLIASAGPARSGPSTGDRPSPMIEATSDLRTSADLRGPRVLPDPARPGTLCDAAVRAAEFRHRLPSGLLFAIGQVESGRPDPTLRRLEPWPWTIQAEGRGIYFDNKAQAVQWVKDARARGLTSIDAGCMQVNLFYHPNAFDTPEDAFDPERNADYAARFLLQLHASTGDWGQATGFYHSQTLTLATSYREAVGRALSGGPSGAGILSGGPMIWPAAPKPPTVLDHLVGAWGATLGSNGSTSAHPAFAGPITPVWGALRPTTHLPPKSTPPLRAQRLPLDVDRTFLSYNIRRP
jgi:hypothetical protein